MLRRILGGLGLVAVLATGAKADNWFEFFQNGGGGGTNYDLYLGGLGPSASGPFTPTFTVWCVDEKNFVTDGNVYKVNITSLNSSDFTKTRANDPAKYILAAKIATSMGSATGVGTAKYQYAMWSVMHNKSGIECRAWDHGNPGNWTPTNQLANCNATDVANVVTGSQPLIDKKAWRVITDIGSAGVTYSPAVGQFQEFLAKCNNVGQPAIAKAAGAIVQTRDCDSFDIPNDTTPTPEPATMSLLALGLAGMAGASFRRRK